MSELLKVEKLSYGTPTGRPLVKDVSFSVRDGDIALVQGPNGIGKSTFLKIVSGQHHALRGAIKRYVPRENMVFFPQLSGGEFHIAVSIDDILQIALMERYDRSKILDLGLLSEKQLARQWNTASGGERQRALLTRVFLQNSNLLILDEPMNHLDRDTRAQVKTKILEYVNDGKKRAVLLVSHEHFDAAEIGRGELQIIDLGKFKYKGRSRPLRTITDNARGF